MIKTEREIFSTKWGELLGYKEDGKGFFRLTPEGERARPVEIVDGRLVVDNSLLALKRQRARENL